MYIIKKHKKKGDYYYLRKSIRVDGKVRTKDVAYLGKTKQEAEAKLKQLQKPKKEKIEKPKPKERERIDEITAFCKRRGFVYPNSEIYGGLAGFWDYGPLGVELKNNIKNEWWKTFVQERPDVAGIDGTIITNPKVWQASGHVTSFTDVLLDCKKCKTRFRGDQLLEDQLKITVDAVTVEEIDKLIKKHNVKCPKCKGEFSNAKSFNLMFKINIGPVEDGTTMSYLRPESAQLIFTDFKLVVENSRLKLPFGIAQMGKAFRNEIAPRNFLFRCREFEQMEIEYFIDPKNVNECPYIKEVLNQKINLLSAEMQNKNQEAKQMTIKQALTTKIIKTPWLAYWLAKMCRWFTGLGIKEENLRLREHKKEELSHYANACFDIEYKFPFGWKELQGMADRTQFDLKQHMKFSKQDLTIFDEKTKQKIIPYVAAEPSQGVERAFLAFLFDAYEYNTQRKNIVLKLNPKLAPFKCAVFPLLSNKPQLTKKAKEVFSILSKEFPTFYDESGSIGRRYFRQDEASTPFCITIDFDSLKKDDITIRDRNTTKQIRVKIKDLVEILKNLLENKIKFEKAGKIIK